MKIIVKLNKLICFSISCTVSIANAYGAYTYEYLQRISTDSIYHSLSWKKLIHYENGKSVINNDSDFFLSSEGYKNPKAEYIATLKAILNSDKEDNNHAICRYPARFNYIVNSLNLAKDKFPTPRCIDYQEYLKKVPLDNIYIVFAAENNQSPSSMLGHTFLKISGQDENGTRQHSFSYFAALDNANSLKFYIDVMTAGLDGAYVLSPYQTKADEYLLGEKRSLWEFELKLSSEEKEKLKQHLWELKGKNIRYKFITHNCNTALMSILKVASEDFIMETEKPFTTPVEYIQYLQQRDKISNIAIEPSISQKKAIERYGLNYIGNAPKPTRFSLQQDFSHNITNIGFSPVYQDIRDISDAYFPDLESKIMDVSFNYLEKHKKIIADTVDILKMASFADYPTTDSYSKFFRLGFENDLFADNNELKPVVEFGLGVGKRIQTTTFYILPKIGYHYDNFSNFYLVPQIGTITRISNKVKVINSYEKYFNSKKDNKGFEAKYNLYLGYNILDNTDLYFNYSHYNKAKYSDSFTMGFSFHF